MADCRRAGAEPVIVVAFDGIYLPAAPGGTSLSYQQALKMAVEWVRYANVTKGYGVKYWSLGNETYLPAGYGGANPGYVKYGQDAAAFAQAMKAVDPSIKIGINGERFEDFNQALATCAPFVDFLDVHTYPCYGFETYDRYRTTAISPLAVVGAAERAIQAVANQRDRERLFIAMTEFSAYGFSPEGAGAAKPWDLGNNLGQSLANFDLMAQLAQDPRVAFSQYWATRWINNDEPITQATDLLSKSNALNPGGVAVKILTQETLDLMVGAEGTSVVRAFASRDETGQHLTVFLLNKATTRTAVELNLTGYTPGAVAKRRVFRGTGAADLNPTYHSGADVVVTGGPLALTLPKVSLTVLRFTGELDDRGGNLVANPGFESTAGGLSPWALVAGGSGQGGVSSDLKVSGNSSGYVGGNWAYLYQVVKGLSPNTTYSADFNVYNYENGGSNVYVGVKNHGRSEDSRAVDDTNFAFVPVNVTFTTGPAATTAELFLYCDSAPTFAWIDDVSLTCTPATAAVATSAAEEAATLAIASVATPATASVAAGTAADALSKLFFPNPTRRSLSLDRDDIDGLRYRVFDVTGREVLDDRVEGQSLSLEGMTPGVYLLRLSDGTQGRVVLE